jgi:hypothetical protein
MNKLTKFLSVTAALFSLTLMVQPNANAQGYIGGLIGMGSAPGSGVSLDSGLVYGGTLGYHLMPEMGVAFTFQHSALETSVGSIDVGVNQYMGELNFFSVVFLQGGIHAGAVNTSVAGASSTDFGFGGHLGFDINLAQQLSVGIEAYYTYVTAENDKHSLLNFIVPIKVAF